MPEFTTEIDIDPSEYVSSCSKREIEELVEALHDDGYITQNTPNGVTNGYYGVRRPNANDERYWESLEHLKKCRDLLTITEEEFINNLADRFKHLR